MLFSINLSFSQQNLITELIGEKYTYKDFNLKSNAELMIVGRAYKVAMGSVPYEYKHYTFNTYGNLISEITSKNKSTINKEKEKTFTYDSNNRLKRINVMEKSILTEQYFINYNEKNQLANIIYRETNTTTKLIYKIDWNKDKAVKYLLTDENGTVLYESFKHEYDKNNNLIRYNFNEEGDLGNSVNSYNEVGLKTSEAHSYTNDASYNFKINYTYNKAYDMLTKSEDDLTIDYEYKTFDTHNNWTEMWYNEYSSSYRTYRTITYFE